MTGQRTALVVAILAAGLLGSMVLAIAVGTITLSPSVVWQVIWAHLQGETHPDPLSDQIIWTLRLPRVLLSAVIGAGLAVSGVALQGLVRNPLADPYVLGVSSGASVGAVLVIGAGLPALAGVSVGAGAFAGALAAMAVVFLLAQTSGRLSGTRLILAGVAISYLGTAITSLVQLRSDPNLMRSILFWLMGSVAGAKWTDLGVPAVVMAICTLWLLMTARSLNALALGDDDAAALGVNVAGLRIGLLLVSSLLTATAVSVAGGVGFVGLMVPHAVRLVVGADHRRVLPVTMVTGAIFVVLVDLATRVVDRPNEYPITVFTAAMGAPFFLWLLRRSQTGLVT